MTRRTERVSELLREEISWLLANEIHDPRLPALVSITRVDLSIDLRHANVYVSILGSVEEKLAGMKMLKTAAGFLHRALISRLTLRAVPELAFQLDESIETGVRMQRLIGNLSPDKDASDAGA